LAELELAVDRAALLLAELPNRRPRLEHRHESALMAAEPPARFAS
jgi:hypothetical protein